MKRTTHILLGAAVAMPIAASLSPAVAAGAVWLGMVGGGYPDWVDLRSDLRSRLKHRGASHSIFIGAALALGLYLVLEVAVAQFSWFNISQTEIQVWTLAFAAGFLSHIVSDACTHAGVRPLLPLSNTKYWVSPKPLRGKSNGFIDTIARFIAMALVIFSLWRFVQQYLT